MVAIEISTWLPRECLDVLIRSRSIAAAAPSPSPSPPQGRQTDDKAAEYAALYEDFISATTTTAAAAADDQQAAAGGVPWPIVTLSRWLLTTLPTSDQAAIDTLTAALNRAAAELWLGQSTFDGPAAVIRRWNAAIRAAAAAAAPPRPCSPACISDVP